MSLLNLGDCGILVLRRHRPTWLLWKLYPAGKIDSEKQWQGTNKRHHISVYSEMSGFEHGLPRPVPLSWMNPIGAVTTIPVDWI